MSLLDDAINELNDALDGSFRRDVIDVCAHRADFRTSLARLREMLRAHSFKAGKRRVDLSRIIAPLDARTQADGFHVLNDWDGVAVRHNPDCIPVDVLSWVADKGAHEMADAAVLGILLDYYFTYVLGLLAMRVWDLGDANANLDRVDELVALVHGSHGSGQAFVKDASTLLVIVTAHYEPDDPAYDRLLDKVRALDAAHRARMGLIHARTMGCHLRFGFEATYARSVRGMREDNPVDYPWLCFALAASAEEYARLIAANAPDADRAPVVEALIGGFSPDAAAFLLEPPSALASSVAERTLLANVLQQHRDVLIRDANAFVRPAGDRYTAIGLSFNFSHNVLKGTIADSVMWGEAGTLSFDDLMTALPQDAARNTARTTLAKTLMGYARKNPEMIGGRLLPVIVYDAQAARRVFALTLELLGRH